MVDATNSVANIFQAEISGRSVAPEDKGAAGDFSETELFNTSPMEGEDSDEPDPEIEIIKQRNKALQKANKGKAKQRAEPEEDEDEEETEPAPRKAAKRHPGEIDADGEDEDEDDSDSEDEDEEAPRGRRKKAEDDEDEDADGEDDEEAPRRRGRLDLDEEVEVKVDGERVRVSLREALEGYSRTKTFHQRLNGVEQEKQVVARDRANYANILVNQQKALDNLLAEVNAMQPQEPNWNELFAKNPAEGVKQKAFWDSFKEQKAGLERAAQENHAQRVAEYQRGLNEHVQREYTKLETVYPHWKDPQAKARDQAAMRKTALKAGFTEQEVNQVYDSRLIGILMKAARFDRLSSKKLQPRQSATKPMSAGSGASRRGTISQEGMRRKAHAKQGSLDSAAGVFDIMLARE